MIIHNGDNLFKAFLCLFWDAAATLYLNYLQFLARLMRYSLLQCASKRMYTPSLQHAARCIFALLAFSIGGSLLYCLAHLFQQYLRLMTPCFFL